MHNVAIMGVLVAVVSLVQGSNLTALFSDYKPLNETVDGYQYWTHPSSAHTYLFCPDICNEWEDKEPCCMCASVPCWTSAVLN